MQCLELIPNVRDVNSLTETIHKTGMVQCLCRTNKPATLRHSVKKTRLKAGDAELMIAGCQFLQTGINFSEYTQQ